MGCGSLTEADRGVDEWPSCVSWQRARLQRTICGEVGLLGSPDSRGDRGIRAEDSINFALLSPLNLVFAGFTFVLFGLANVFSDAYPRWLGWAAVAGGVGSAISGVIQAYLGEPTGITQTLGIVGPSLITLWLLIIGVFLLRGRWPGRAHEGVRVGRG